MATRKVRGGAKLGAATAAPGAEGVTDEEDAPEAAFDPDALLPRTDIGPQLNEVRPVASSSQQPPPQIFRECITLCTAGLAPA